MKDDPRERPVEGGDEPEQEGVALPASDRLRSETQPRQSSDHQGDEPRYGQQHGKTHRRRIDRCRQRHRHGRTPPREAERKRDHDDTERRPGPLAFDLQVLVQPQPQRGSRERTESQEVAPCEADEPDRPPRTRLRPARKRAQRHDVVKTGDDQVERGRGEQCENDVGPGAPEDRPDLAHVDLSQLLPSEPGKDAEDDPGPERAEPEEADG